MSEVHRYQVVTMLSAAGATIGYDPHGPDVVMAADFDRVTAERDALQALLSAADERLDAAVNLLEIWRTWLGPTRESCDETGKKVWDRIDAVTAPKPAEPAKDEHVCTGCGSKGWTANCAGCVPY